jgi:hypothetical protein
LSDINLGININFKPSKKQYEAWQYLTDQETEFIGYGGAAFSGKTYLLGYFLTSMSIAYPDTGWGLGRKELTILKKTTLITMFKVFDECNIIHGRDFEFNQQLNVITFYNKSQIFLIDTAYAPNDPLFTRLGGYELTGCAVDESAETHHAAIDILYTRIGRRKNKEYGIKKKFLETFNPAKNHVYDRYYKPLKDGKQKAGHQFVKALPADNPSPDVPDYVKGILANGATVTIERLIYGNFEFDDDPLTMMDYDKILELFTNTFIQPTPDKYLIADIAYEGSDLFVIGYWEGLVLQHIEAIEKCDELHIGKTINDLRVRYSVPMGNVLYDADGLKKFVQQSAKTGLLQGAKQFHNNGTPLNKENYYNLKSQCYFKAAELVNTNKIFINFKPYRDQIIKECEQIKQLPLPDDGKLRVEKKADLKLRLGHSPDFFDMLAMRCFFEIKPVHQTTFISFK